MLQSITKPRCLELFGSCLTLCGINDWDTGRQQILKLDDCLALVSCHDSLVPDWVSTKVPENSLVIAHSSYAPIITIVISEILPECGFVISPRLKRSKCSFS